MRPSGSGSLAAPRARRPTRSSWRCWSTSEPRCSSPPLQVFATDISEAAIERPAPPSTPVHHRECLPRAPAALLREADGGYQVTKSVRSLCVFARQNLVSDPPFSRIDLVSCRNVLIYLGPVLQKKVLPIFHYALRPEGFLVLGSSESGGRRRGSLLAGGQARRIYRKKTTAPQPGLHFTYREPSVRAAPRPPGASSSPLRDRGSADRRRTASSSPGTGPPASSSTRTWRSSTSAATPAPYLELLPGVASLNLLKMVREGPGAGAARGPSPAKKSGRRVRKEGLVGERSEDALRKVNLEVHPLSAAIAGRGAATTSCSSRRSSHWAAHAAPARAA